MYVRQMECRARCDGGSGTQRCPTAEDCSTAATGHSAALRKSRCHPSVHRRTPPHENRSTAGEYPVSPCKTREAAWLQNPWGHARPRTARSVRCWTPSPRPPITLSEEQEDMNLVDLLFSDIIMSCLSQKGGSAHAMSLDQDYAGVPACPHPDGVPKVSHATAGRWEIASC